MLYDPKWRGRTLEGPMALQNFIAWLETKDPEEKYDWEDPRICVLAQFLGETAPCYAGAPWRDIAYATEPFTFGAALKRARIVAARRENK
jgi:hypothetical protein